MGSAKAGATSRETQFHRCLVLTIERIRDTDNVANALGSLQALNRVGSCGLANGDQVFTRQHTGMCVIARTTSKNTKHDRPNELCRVHFLLLGLAREAFDPAQPRTTLIR